MNELNQLMVAERAVFANMGTGGELVQDIGKIIERAQQAAYRSVDVMLVYRNWFIGKRISEEELKGGARAAYGRSKMSELSASLTFKYGKGFDPSNLYKYLAFFRRFPILDTLCPKSGMRLGWSHYRVLLQVESDEALRWYLDEAAAETWGVRVLQRNISSQYYERMLLSQAKDPVRAEMVELTEPLRSRLEFIKNPVIAEFLGVKQDTSFTEETLETAILDNLREFLMELGKGYAFVARQQHIHTEKDDYYIDLVFYNYILKCFVLIDLKTSKITHQDIGQMDMYVRMYDELKRGEGDNPTLGIILCSDTDSDIAKYSMLRGNEQLFATKYRLCLPSEAELKTEIESQKQRFVEQHSRRGDTGMRDWE